MYNNNNWDGTSDTNFKLCLRCCRYGHVYGGICVDYIKEEEDANNGED